MAESHVTCLQDEEEGEHDWRGLVGDPPYNAVCFACGKKAQQVKARRTSEVLQEARNRAGDEGIGY
jgi:hypothetical protein